MCVERAPVVYLIVSCQDTHSYGDEKPTRSRALFPACGSQGSHKGELEVIYSGFQ